MTAIRQLAEFRDFEPRETQSTLIVQALAGSALKTTLDQVTNMENARRLAKRGDVYTASLTYPHASAEPRMQAILAIENKSNFRDRLFKKLAPEVQGMLIAPECRQPKRVGAILLATVLDRYTLSDYVSFRFSGVYDTRVSDFIFGATGIVGEPYAAPVDGRPVMLAPPQHIETLHASLSKIANV